MSVPPRLPDDPEQCVQLLHDLLRRNDELRQQAEDAQQQAEDAQQQAEDAQRRIDELQRVLEATAADYSQLQEKHAELAETLALFRRYLFGPRRERLRDDPGQGHLFDLHDTAFAPETAAPTAPDTASPVQRPKAAGTKRRTSLDHLPHIRIEQGGFPKSVMLR